MSDWKTLLGNDEQRAHNAWFDRGRKGPGRLEIEVVNVAGPRTFEFDAETCRRITYA